MKENDSEKNNRLNQLKELFGSLKGRTPDYENLDQADPSQTEEKYQEEQKRWLEEVRKKKMSDSFIVHSIGIVKKTDSRTWIEIKPRYKDALLGLDGFSHIHVLFWFHENDTPKERGVMQVHPRRDPENPLTGVFATHSPHRPNLVGVTLCRILSINEGTIDIESIDARDQTPVVDIKCYIPHQQEISDIMVPDWVCLS
jgi:tRNA-Thr(GGU) m(6)t(6)A37 methyltransferase TsaA